MHNARMTRMVKSMLRTFMFARLSPRPGTMPALRIPVPIQLIALISPGAPAKTM